MQRRTLLSAVNMTPLVDVMLVVLVLFLITSPLLLAGPDVVLPNVRAATLPLDDAEAVISVTRDGTVYYKQLRVDGDLARVLLEDAAFLRTRHVYVRGDRDASFGAVSAVLAVTHRVAKEGVDLVVDPEHLTTDGQR